MRSNLSRLAHGLSRPPPAPAQLVGATAAARMRDGTTAGDRFDVLIAAVIAVLIAVQTLGDGRAIALAKRVPRGSFPRR